MKIAEAREWLINHANETGDEILKYNVERVYNKLEMWREYINRRAQVEGVEVTNGYPIPTPATTEKEVCAARIVEQIFKTVTYISDGRVVYKADWSICEDKDLWDFRIVQNPDEILTRYGS